MRIYDKKRKFCRKFIFDKFKIDWIFYASGFPAPKNIPAIQVICSFRRAIPRGAQCKEFRKFLPYIPTGSRITLIFFQPYGIPNG